MNLQNRLVPQVLLQDMSINTMLMFTIWGKFLDVPKVPRQSRTHSRGGERPRQRTPYSMDRPSSSPKFRPESFCRVFLEMSFCETTELVIEKKYPEKEEGGPSQGNGRVTLSGFTSHFQLNKLPSSRSKRSYTIRHTL